MRSPSADILYVITPHVLPASKTDPPPVVRVRLPIRLVFLFVLAANSTHSLTASLPGLAGRWLAELSHIARRPNVHGFSPKGIPRGSPISTCSERIRPKPNSIPTSSPSSSCGPGPGERWRCILRCLRSRRVHPWALEHSYKDNTACNKTWPLSTPC